MIRKENIFFFNVRNLSFFGCLALDVNAIYNLQTDFEKLCHQKYVVKSTILQICGLMMTLEEKFVRHDPYLVSPIEPNNNSRKIMYMVLRN